MAMDSFSYTDTVRAAFASCLPCFSPSPSDPHSTPCINVNGTGPRASSSNDLEHLLRDSDSDALSLHSNLRSSPRRTKKRGRPKFSLTLFGYTLIGRPPIYLSDDEDGDDTPGGGRATAFTSSSTLDSDAAPLDASAIERLSSPDHHAAAQRERERQRVEEEEQARRKAERRARRQERQARERAATLMALSGATLLAERDEFEGFQGSGSIGVPTSVHDVVRVDTVDGDDALSGDADDADLGGELYTRKKRQSTMGSRSGSDSRSRTSTSFSAGDASHNQHTLSISQQSIPYPQTAMHLPPPRNKKSTRSSKRTSTVSSATSQSTSPALYTPVESIIESPAVASFPVPQERYIRSGVNSDFPIAGLAGRQRQKSFDPKVFLATNLKDV